MVNNSKTSGKTASVTPSTASLNQKLATSPGPRPLTESELELLQRSAREIYNEALAELLVSGA